MAEAAAKTTAEPIFEEAPSATGELNIEDSLKMEPALRKTASIRKFKRIVKEPVAVTSVKTAIPEVIARTRPAAKRQIKSKSITKSKPTTPTKNEVATMAKTKTRKSKINKSAKIREELAATPDKSAAEIAKKVGVTPALVYNVKASLLKKSQGTPKKKPGRKPGSTNAAKNGAAAANGHHLDSALDFVTKVGGLLHAEQLIGKLKSIKERL